MILERSVVFSGDEKYRYHLGRVLEGESDRKIVWLMLNPSTADGLQDDPTIRRVCYYSTVWGFTQVSIVNLFAFRSPEPRLLISQDDPVGPENDYYILYHCLSAHLIVCGWGNWGRLFDRAVKVKKMLPFRLSCLGVTSSGHPRHPLYLPNNSELEVWAGL